MLVSSELRLIADMFDFRDAPLEFGDIAFDKSKNGQVGARVRWSKVIFDVLVSVILLVPLCIITLILLALNPVLNAGPLLFLQRRMGQNCEPFIAIKFRTMGPERELKRGAFDAVEMDRISRLGHVLRTTRIDELPQIINVLLGQMSLIGPRPDAFSHACVYLKSVPGYALRHQVLPGISGYAQTEVGYVQSFAGVQRKVAADLYYISHLSFSFDLWITWRTLCVVLGRRGS